MVIHDKVAPIHKGKVWLGIVPLGKLQLVTASCPTSAQDGLDPLQLALVVFFCYQLAQRPHLHLQWALPATCAGGVFLVHASTFTNVHA